MAWSLGKDRSDTVSFSLVADSPLLTFSVAEVTHTLHPGVFDGMANCLVARYVIPRVSHFTLFEYPFEEEAGRPPLQSHYDNGSLTKRVSVCVSNVTGTLSFLRDYFCTVFHFIRNSRRYDYFVGVDSLNAASGLMLKALRRVRVVCFYSIDYSPKRFSQPILNLLYRFLEIVVTRKSDYVWCCSEQIQAIRSRQRGSIDGCLIVTPGLIPESDESIVRERRSRLVFVGRLAPGKGIDLTIKAMRFITKSVPDCELWILGDGPFRADLERLTQSLGLANSVKFFGFLPDYDDVTDLIRQCDIGIACYDPSFGYERYAFPGKVVQYLADGLPVIMTSIPPYSVHLTDSMAGLVVKYDEMAISASALRLLTDHELYRKCRDNARKLAARYDISAGLERALGAIKS